MSKKNEKQLVPEWRFPEFRGKRKWEEKLLNDIAVFYKGKGISKSDIDPQGETPCIRYGELYTIYDEVIGEVFSKTKLPSSLLFLCKSNDVLIPSSGETKIDIAKASCVLLDDVALGGDLNVLRSNTNGIFLSYLLNGASKREISKKAQGDTIVHLYASQLKLLKVVIPMEAEQQKIADCLTSLDELITAEAGKLEAYKAHKKGMMQKLFPAEGKTVPEWRFPEFRDCGEWEVKTVDKIKLILTDYVANGSFQSLRENLNVLESEDYAFYVRLTDLRAGLGHSKQKYVDKSTYLFLKKSSLFGGELLMANIGAKVGEVWQMPFVDKPATLAPNMIMIKFGSNIDIRFIYNFLTSDIGIENISTVISGSGHPKISKTDLKQVKIFLPLKLKEQKKIADCLTSLDELITAQAKKIDALKAHKKGLMQGLFPSAYEVGV